MHGAQHICSVACVRRVGSTGSDTAASRSRHVSVTATTTVRPGRRSEEPQQVINDGPGVTLTMIDCLVPRRIAPIAVPLLTVEKNLN